MSYDEELAARLRDLLDGEAGVAERRMFGGDAFLVDGHLAVCASAQGGLLLRCPPDRTDGLCAEPHTTRFVMNGREMTGWLHVEPPALDTDDDLRRWVAIGLAYARSLPPK